MDANLAQLVFAIGRTSESGIQLLGTGFAISKDRIATTAHVTGASDKDLCVVIPKIKRLEEYQDTTNANVNVVAAELQAYDPIRDIAILSLKADVTFSFAYKLGSSDAVPTGTPIATLGYPHADHGRLVLTEQLSAVGARMILGSKGIQTKHLVLNIQTRPGQSGSPVFNASGTVLAAMIIGGYAPGGGGGINLGGIDPQTLHQTTHAISAEYISELVS